MPIRLLALTLLLLPFRLDAGQDVWTPIGPEGGLVTDLAFSANGRTVYAGTLDSGVYKSVNSGRSWAPAGDGIRGAVEDVETDPTAPALVYVITSEGIFKSDDAGATWTDLTSRLPGLERSTFSGTVITSPAEPGTVYVSLYDPYTFDPGAVQAQVYRSTDRGASWRSAAFGLPRTQPVQALAAHPRQRGVLFAGTPDGLFRSTDSGRTWVRFGLRGSDIVQVAFDPLRPERLYAVRMVEQHHDSYPEVLVSTRGGQTWSAGSGTSGFSSVDLVVDPFTPGTAYLGVSVTHGTAIYKTTDGGGHWSPLLPPSDSAQQSGVQALAANPRVPGMLLTSRNDFGDRAILRSLDDGASWAASGSGFRGLPARQVVSDPEDQDTLYLITYCCAIWKTDDAGRTWRRLGGGLPPGVYEGLAIDPAVPSTLYVSTSSGMFKSLDGGETWSRLENSFSAVELAIDPTRPATLYGAMVQTVRKSPDAGITWEVLPTQEAHTKTVIAIAPSSPATLYTNGIYSVVFFPPLEERRDSINRSTDGGATWSTIFQLGIQGGFVRDLLVHPQDPDLVVVAFAVHTGPLYDPVSGGVFRSTGGGRWRRSSLSPENPPVFTLAQDPCDPARIYAGAPGAVFVSGDRGATWTSMSPGLPPGEVRDLEVDPFDPGTIYAATDGGLYSLTYHPRR